MDVACSFILSFLAPKQPSWILSKFLHKKGAKGAEGMAQPLQADSQPKNIRKMLSQTHVAPGLSWCGEVSRIKAPSLTWLGVWSA